MKKWTKGYQQVKHKTGDHKSKRKVERGSEKYNQEEIGKMETGKKSIPGQRNSAGVFKSKNVQTQLNNPHGRSVKMH